MQDNTFPQSLLFLLSLERGSFGTALVVRFDSTAMIGEKLTASLFPKIRGVQNDYPSGVKPPRSKGCRHFK